jgi:hypothetical protein
MTGQNAPMKILVIPVIENPADTEASARAAPKVHVCDTTVAFAPRRCGISDCPLRLSERRRGLGAQLFAATVCRQRGVTLDPLSLKSFGFSAGR